MGDHFVLMVDRLLTDSTLEAAIRSGHRSCVVKPAPEDAVTGTTTTGDEQVDDDSWWKRTTGRCCATEWPPAAAVATTGSGKMVECRICQEEDDQGNMEAPCDCCGSLKYAHRKCVQRWCDEKGDTVCEICLQQFKPGYTAPVRSFCYGDGLPVRISVSSRGGWQMTGQDYSSHPVIAMLAADSSYSDATDYDDYVSSSARSTLYFRLVAVIFLLLLVLRHALPIILSGNEYSFTILSLVLLRVAGIIVPIYFMAQALSVRRRRRQQQ